MLGGREDECDAALVVEGFPRRVECDAGVVEARELDGGKEGGEGVCDDAGLAPEVGNGGCGECQWGGERGGDRAKVVAEGKEREGDLGLHRCGCLCCLSRSWAGGWCSDIYTSYVLEGDVVILAAVNESLETHCASSLSVSGMPSHARTRTTIPMHTIGPRPEICSL